MSEYRNLQIRYAEGSSNLGRVRNRTNSWPKIIERLSTPNVTAEKFNAYLDKPKDEQDALKNIGGYWIGGHCADGKRNAAAIRERDVLCLDIDDAPATLLTRIEYGVTGISQYEWFAHSTRKHTITKPRLRIVIPLAQPVGWDAFTPFARIFASLFDPSMDAVDDVSFRIAQMMFYPSHSIDSPFFTFHNEGALADPTTILAEWGQDWRNYELLPYSERQGQKRPSAAKAEDPTMKSGIVGTFCRAYDVEEAIATFLPEIYVPGDSNSQKPRYSFVGGTTTNGAVVEDGGLFLYSFHTTDPVSDRLVNAFDLVRIHKFGDLDSEATKDDKPGDMPSFKAMREWALTDDKIRSQGLADRYDQAAMFDDISDDDEIEEPKKINGAPVVEAKKPSLSAKLLDLIGDVGDAPRKRELPADYDPDWMSALSLDKELRIKNTIPNIATILASDVRLFGAPSVNAHTNEIVCRRTIASRHRIVPPVTLLDAENGDRWSDDHDVTIRAILALPNGRGRGGYDMTVGADLMRDAVRLAGNKNKFHPVKDYLETLTWDGTSRLETLFSRFLGVPDNVYTREAARLWMTAGVTRIYEPGHKFDFAIVLQGPQGIRKSSFLKVLGHRRWFKEVSGDLSEQRDIVEGLSGAWIAELPELSALSKSGVEEVKAWMTRQIDRVRLSYDRRASDFARQFICGGTTNNDQWLKDPTGNRRFWPLICVVRMIDTDGVAAEVDQLWAEALTCYRNMRRHNNGELPLFLSEEAEAIARGLQEAARIEMPADQMAGRVEAFLNAKITEADLDPHGFADLESGSDQPMRRCLTCIAEIWQRCLGNPKSPNPSESQSVAQALSKIPGWMQAGGRTVNFPQFGRQRAYVRMSARLKGGYHLEPWPSTRDLI